MKHLLIIVLGLNFVACSKRNHSSSTSPLPKTEASSVDLTNLQLANEQLSSQLEALKTQNEEFEAERKRLEAEEAERRRLQEEAEQEGQLTEAEKARLAEQQKVIINSVIQSIPSVHDMKPSETRKLRKAVEKGKIDESIAEDIQWIQDNIPVLVYGSTEIQEQAQTQVIEILSNSLDYFPQRVEIETGKKIAEVCQGFDYTQAEVNPEAENAKCIELKKIADGKRIPGLTAKAIVEALKQVSKDKKVVVVPGTNFQDHIGPVVAGISTSPLARTGVVDREFVENNQMGSYDATLNPEVQIDYSGHGVKIPGVLYTPMSHVGFDCEFDIKKMKLKKRYKARSIERKVVKVVKKTIKKQLKANDHFPLERFIRARVNSQMANIVAAAKEESKLFPRSKVKKVLAAALADLIPEVEDEEEAEEE